jgi:hypothetical protein
VLWACPVAADPGPPLRTWIWSRFGPRPVSLPAPDAEIAHVYICTVCDYIENPPANRRSGDKE